MTVSGKFCNFFLHFSNLILLSSFLTENWTLFYFINSSNPLFFLVKKIYHMTPRIIGTKADNRLNTLKYTSALFILPLGPNSWTISSIKGQPPGGFFKAAHSQFLCPIPHSGSIIAITSATPLIAPNAAYRQFVCGCGCWIPKNIYSSARIRRICYVTIAFCFRTDHVMDWRLGNGGNKDPMRCWETLFFF